MQIRAYGYFILSNSVRIELINFQMKLCKKFFYTASFKSFFIFIAKSK